MRWILRIPIFLGLLILVILLFFSTWAFVREREIATEVAPSHGRFISAGDVILYIQTTGDAKNPPLLLLHGMAAWSGTWKKTADVLAEEGWYVIAVDMPPFGFSQRPSDFSFWRRSQAQRLEALLDSLDISRTVLVAHSYGSRAAIEMTMQHPERIRALVLIDSALDVIYDGGVAQPSFTPKLLSIPVIQYPLIASTMTNPFLNRTLLQLFMHKKEAATDEILLLYQMPSRLVGSTSDLGRWVIGFLDGSDAGLSRKRSEYEKLAIPTVIIWGAEDTTTPLSQGRALQSFIKKSRLIVLEGVGHMPHIEDASQFNDALVAELKDFQ